MSPLLLYQAAKTDETIHEVLRHLSLPRTARQWLGEGVIHILTAVHMQVLLLRTATLHWKASRILKTTEISSMVISHPVAYSYCFREEGEP